MTRDEHRNACLNAVATAMCGAGWETLPERDVLLAHAVKIFDSLNGIAAVFAATETELLINIGILTNPPEPKP